MFMSATKKTTVKLRDKTDGIGQVQQIHQPKFLKEAIVNHEFILTSRVLFAPDGTILPCLDKSKLIDLINQLLTLHEYQQPEDGMDNISDAPSRKIALLDGVILLQKMAKKPAII
jgi:hypothetical protein